MLKIAIVTTVYNRIESVRLHLASLAQQTRRDFMLVVADDGSTQDIFGELSRHTGVFPYHYQRGSYKDPLLGVRVRNQGCRVGIGALATHLWLTDADIVFNPKAVEWAYRHLEEKWDVVIAGRYDWMPPMEVTVDDLALQFDDFVGCRLPRLSVTEASIGGGAVIDQGRHADPRSAWNIWGDCLTTYNCKAGCLGSNLIVPAEAFLQTGGYDENMPPACNAGDCEFGFNLALHGWRNIHCEHIVGYHLYHERDTTALTLGVRKGIVYICKKYDEPFDPKLNLPKLPPGVTDEWSGVDGSQEEK